MFKPEVESQLQIVCQQYKGNGAELEKALGCLMMSHFYGWRVTKLMHGKNRWTKYKRILGLEIEKVCDPETDLSPKNIAYRIWKQTGRYWDIVMDRLKVPEGKQTLS